MLKKGSSVFVIIVALGAATFFLVAGFFSRLADERPVVVAKQSIAAGTRLTASLLDVKQVNAGALLPGALKDLKEAEGQLLTAARMPGDQLTADMVGDKAVSSIAASLPKDHRAIAIHVNQASGLAGLLRVGDTVSAIGVLDPQNIQAVTSARNMARAERKEPWENPGAISRVLLRDLRVLLVPQTFRYQEAPEDTKQGAALMPLRTTGAMQKESVVVLDVPLAPVEVLPGYFASPAEVLALLDAQGRVYLALQPAVSGYPSTGGVRLDELLDRMGLELRRPTSTPSPSPMATPVSLTPPTPAAPTPTLGAKR
jgi:Flp pilus assembly protein CpaB